MGPAQVIVDSSALVAVIRAEPEGPAMARALAHHGATRISAVTYVEASVVIERKGDPVVRREFDDLLGRVGITIEPVTVEQAEVARAAYRDFGKGSGHPAKLNLGDCFAYALAKTAREPLLCKGGDFSHTDVECVPLDL